MRSRMLHAVDELGRSNIRCILRLYALAETSPPWDGTGQGPYKRTGVVTYLMWPTPRAGGEG